MGRSTECLSTELSVESDYCECSVFINNGFNCFISSANKHQYCRRRYLSYNTYYFKTPYRCTCNAWSRHEHVKYKCGIRLLLKRLYIYIYIYIYIYLLTDLLTPGTGVFFRTITILLLVKKFYAFYGTRKFMTAFTSVFSLSIS